MLKKKRWAVIFDGGATGEHIDIVEARTILGAIKYARHTHEHWLRAEPALEHHERWLADQTRPAESG